jgi:hypothetical protein
VVFVVILALIDRVSGHCRTGPAARRVAHIVVEPVPLGLRAAREFREARSGAKGAAG